MCFVVLSDEPSYLEGDFFISLAISGLLICVCLLFLV